MVTSGLFVLAISFYLVSIVAALTSTLFSKLISTRVINTLIIFHFLTFAGWCVFKLIESSEDAPGNANYFFLVYFCSGIISAGLILRKKYPIYFKIYFSWFLASILIFIFSPSRVIGFVSSGNLNTINPDRIHLSENYFLVEQQGKATTTEKSYKLVREMGMFHKTLAREIQLPKTIDSVKLINFIEKKEVFVIIYNRGTEKELHIPLDSSSNNSSEITKKPN